MVYIGVILGLDWVHIGSILGPYWVHIGFILGSSQSNPALLLEAPPHCLPSHSNRQPGATAVSLLDRKIAGSISPIASKSATSVPKPFHQVVENFLSAWPYI